VLADVGLVVDGGDVEHPPVEGRGHAPEPTRAYNLLTMAVIVDPPQTPGHGRLWAHVASDSSYDELHAFARRFGIPERGFDRDHYDVPAEWYQRLLEAGAEPVSSRELVARLTASGLRRPKAHTLFPRRPGRLLLRPPRLRSGDLVAVVRPAGPVDPDRLYAGVDVLRSWGLEVRLPRTADASHPWLASSDETRSEELTAAWTDPDVRCVWAARGGYGVHRLLDVLDWERLAGAAPRALVGFSDLTALHQAFATRLGVASVHGPGVAALGQSPPAVLEATRLLVMEGGPVALTGRPGPNVGVAEGVLVGGNLTVLASSAGTALVRPAVDGIALLEDVAEQPYRLDRAVTQLLRSGWLDQARGVALGSFTACGDPQQVRSLLLERLGPLGVPIVHDLPVGHAPGDLPVPLGVRARLDSAAGTLELGRGLR
jgi:muramoyltetrapeptide carboxypeptidase